MNETIKKYFVTNKCYAFMSKTWITACQYLFAFNQIFVLTLSDTFMCDDADDDDDEKSL